MTRPDQHFTLMLATHPVRQRVTARNNDEDRLENIRHNIIKSEERIAQIVILMPFSKAGPEGYS